MTAEVDDERGIHPQMLRNRPTWVVITTASANLGNAAASSQVVNTRDLLTACLCTGDTGESR